MNTLIKWEKGLEFKAKGESGFWVPMGPNPIEGKREAVAATPMELLLMSVGGCTAMDVAYILQKKRIEFEDFWVEMGSEKADTHPKVYTSIHMKFVFVGKGLLMKDMEQAVNLSADKYCSAGIMVGKSARITREIEIREK